MAECPPLGKELLIPLPICFDCTSPGHFLHLPFQRDDINDSVSYYIMQKRPCNEDPTFI